MKLLNPTTCCIRHWSTELSYHIPFKFRVSKLILKQIFLNIFLKSGLPSSANEIRMINRPISSNFSSAHVTHFHLVEKFYQNVCDETYRIWHLYF